MTLAFAPRRQSILRILPQSIPGRPRALLAVYPPAMECWSELERVAFGRRLADARQAKGLTQDDIAAIFDISKQAVSHWERGRNQPTAEQLSILARELQVSADWLLSGRAAPNLPPELSPDRLASLPDDLLQQAIGAVRVVLAMAESRKQPARAA